MLCVHLKLVTRQQMGVQDIPLQLFLPLQQQSHTPSAMDLPFFFYMEACLGESVKEKQPVKLLQPKNIRASTRQS